MAASVEERKQVLNAELKRIVDLIIKVYSPEKIILFGSLLAEGTIVKGSDIDLVIIKNTKKRFLERLDEVYSNIEPTVSVDILVYTPEEFQDMSQWSSFIKSLLKKGKVLYEAR